MNDVKRLRTMLILSFFLLSFGGFMLHARIHPIFAKETPEAVVAHFKFPNFLANLGSFLSFTLITILFLKKKNAVTAQVLNGMLVIMGTILMSHFSWATMEPPLTLTKLILKSTLADIIILWANFFIGQIIYQMNPDVSSG